MISLEEKNRLLDIFNSQSESQLRSFIKGSIIQSEYDLIYFLLENYHLRPDFEYGRLLGMAFDKGDNEENLQFIHFLLNHSEFDLYNNSEIPLTSALHQEPHILELLLNDTRVQCEKAISNCFIFACRHNRYNHIESIIKHSKCNPFYRNNEALMSAFFYGYIRIIKYFFEYTDIGEQIELTYDVFNTKKTIDSENLVELTWPLYNSNFKNDLILYHERFSISHKNLLEQIKEKANKASLINKAQQF